MTAAMAAAVSGAAPAPPAPANSPPPLLGGGALFLPGSLPAPVAPDLVRWTAEFIRRIGPNDESERVRQQVFNYVRGVVLETLVPAAAGGHLAAAGAGGAGGGGGSAVAFRRGHGAAGGPAAGSSGGPAAAGVGGGGGGVFGFAPSGSAGFGGGHHYGSGDGGFGGPGSSAAAGGGFSFNVSVLRYGSLPLRTYLPTGDVDVVIAVYGDDGELKGEAVSHACLEALHARFLQLQKQHQESDGRAPPFPCAASSGETAPSGETDGAAAHCSPHAPSKPTVSRVSLVDAEVKVLKATVNDVAIDLSVNKVGGACSFVLLDLFDRYLCRQSHLFKRSILLVKAWSAFESRTLGSRYGLLATYGVEVLLLCLFACDARLPHAARVGVGGGGGVLTAAPSPRAACLAGGNVFTRGAEGGVFGRNSAAPPCPDPFDRYRPAEGSSLRSSTPLHVLRAFLAFYGNLDWENFAVTACGLVPLHWLRPEAPTPPAAAARIVLTATGWGAPLMAGVAESLDALPQQIFSSHHPRCTTLFVVCRCDFCVALDPYLEIKAADFFAGSRAADGRAPSTGSGEVSATSISNASAADVVFARKTAIFLSQFRHAVGACCVPSQRRPPSPTLRSAAATAAAASPGLCACGAPIRATDVPVVCAAGAAARGDSGDGSPGGSMRSLHDGVRGIRPSGGSGGVGGSAGSGFTRGAGGGAGGFFAPTNSWHGSGNAPPWGSAFSRHSSRAFLIRAMNIVDPLQPNNNLGRSVSPANYRRIVAAYQRASALLEDIISSGSAHNLELFFQRSVLYGEGGLSARLPLPLWLPTPATWCSVPSGGMRDALASAGAGSEAECNVRDLCTAAKKNKFIYPLAHPTLSADVARGLREVSRLVTAAAESSDPLVATPQADPASARSGERAPAAGAAAAVPAIPRRSTGVGGSRQRSFSLPISAEQYLLSTSCQVDGHMIMSLAAIDKPIATLRRRYLEQRLRAILRGAGRQSPPPPPTPLESNLKGFRPQQQPAPAAAKAAAKPQGAPADPSRSRQRSGSVVHEACNDYLLAKIVPSRRGGAVPPGDRSAAVPEAVRETILRRLFDGGVGSSGVDSFKLGGSGGAGSQPLAKAALPRVSKVRDAKGDAGGDAGGDVGGDSGGDLGDGVSGSCAAAAADSGSFRSNPREVSALLALCSRLYLPSSRRRLSPRGGGRGVDGPEDGAGGEPLLGVKARWASSVPQNLFEKEDFPTFEKALITAAHDRGGRLRPASAREIGDFGSFAAAAAAAPPPPPAVAVTLQTSPTVPLETLRRLVKEATAGRERGSAAAAGSETARGPAGEGGGRHGGPAGEASAAAGGAASAGFAAAGGGGGGGKGGPSAGFAAAGGGASDCGGSSAGIAAAGGAGGPSAGFAAGGGGGATAVGGSGGAPLCPVAAPPAGAKIVECARRPRLALSVEGVPVVVPSAYLRDPEAFAHRCPGLPSFCALLARAMAERGAAGAAAGAAGIAPGGGGGLRVAAAAGDYTDVSALTTAPARATGGREKSFQDPRRRTSCDAPLACAAPAPGPRGAGPAAAPPAPGRRGSDSQIVCMRASRARAGPGPLRAPPRDWGRRRGSGLLGPAGVTPPEARPKPLPVAVASKP